MTDTPSAPTVVASMTVDEAIDYERRLNARVALLARKRKPTDADVQEATAWDQLMRHIGDALDQAAADTEHPLQPDALASARFRGDVRTDNATRKRQSERRIRTIRDWVNAQ
jgi:hypothetical protein